jgi:hypothetical protein
MGVAAGRQMFTQPSTCGAFFFATVDWLGVGRKAGASSRYIILRLSFFDILS